MTDDNMLLNLALDVGELMITNGAETNRVEDTMERILSADDNKMPESFVTPTGLFASVQSEISGSRTKFKRITARTMNMEKITRANSLSRDFVSGKLSLEDAFEEVKNIHKLKAFPPGLVVLSYGIVSASFTLIFHGTWQSGCVSFAVGVFLGLFKQLLSRHKVADFLISLFGGAFICILTLLFYQMKTSTGFDESIIGTLMLLVPGVPLTNAVRDIISGDYLSGTSRIMEAIITAVAIATGVGIVLQFHLRI